MTMADEIARVGPLFWPLLACSLLASAIAIERVWVLARVWRAEFAETAPRPMWRQALSLIEGDGRTDRALREERAALWLEERQRSLHRGLRALGLIAAISPLIGLLGTVIGMIDAFAAIAALSGGVKPAIIADGLWQAMLTTAIGLSIAIPVLVLQFLLRGFADRMVTRWQDALNRAALGMAESRVETSPALRAPPRLEERAA
jgi:biopolymer transport protein ExbB